MGRNIWIVGFIFLIFVLPSCVSRKSHRDFLDSNIVRKDSVHIDIKRDSLSYDSTRTLTQKVFIDYSPKSNKESTRFWTIVIGAIAIAAAILIKITAR